MQSSQPSDTSTEAALSGEGDPAGDAESTARHGSVQGGPLLSEERHGQAAIDGLGDKIIVVADRAGMSVDALKDLLLKSPSIHVTQEGDLVYRDGFGRD